MNKPALHLEITDGIALLLLGNPPRNELTITRLRELGVMIEKLVSANQITGLVLSGRGRHFSSGANAAELLQSPTFESPAAIIENRGHFQLLEDAPFPVVAAIRGCCFGVGLELALACQYRLATPRAVFALPEVEYGLIPGCGGTVRLGKQIGTGPAIELLLSGRRFLADEAYRFGIVDRIVDNAALIDAARLAVKQAARYAGQPTTRNTEQ